jgi:hypothetical protein
MLGLRRLLVRGAVAYHGSPTAAARILGHTQPAVTHHIRRLEGELGTPLVRPPGRGVRLTEADAAQSGSVIRRVGGDGLSVTVTHRQEAQAAAVGTTRLSAAP